MANTEYEKKLWNNGCMYVAGADETGLGSFIGPLYTAVVVFPENIDYLKLLPGINDSKKLSAADRERLYPLIKEHALAWSVDSADIDEIAEHNVYWARFISVNRAISNLKITPDYVLMDGNAEVPNTNIPQIAIVKGDSKSITIAASSILAKVDRDRHIVSLASQVHDDYGWASNKGYHSKNHVAALKKHGKTKWHREKFIRKFEIGGSSDG